MQSFNYRRKGRSFMAMLLLIGLSLHLVLLTGQPASAQSSSTSLGSSAASYASPDINDCMHLATMRLPHCRGRLIWLFVARWVEAHLQYDPTRWAMPVYLEIDDAEQWQRISVLCLHLTGGLDEIDPGHNHCQQV